MSKSNNRAIQAGRAAAALEAPPSTTTWLTMPRHPDGMPNAAMAQVIEADSAREAAAHFYMDAVVVACHVVTPHDPL